MTQDDRPASEESNPLEEDCAAKSFVKEKVQGIWSDLLLEEVGLQDNFFALGGQSILATKMVARVRKELAVMLPVRALFDAPTVEAFSTEIEAALRLGAGETFAPPIAAVDRAGLLTPSFAQQRLWFLAQLEGVSEAYHIPLGLRLRGDLNESALRRALDCLVARHETLRTSFYTKDGELYQRIGAEDAGFTLRFEDLSGRADGAEELVRQIREEGTHPFDLEQGPLIRGRLLRLGDQEHVLLITMHHIVSDGWSMGILSRELGALYEAYSLGKPDPLAPLEIQYADYASWQRQWLSGEVLAEQGAYWQQMLEDGPALIELPTDHRRPVQQEFAGATVGLELDEGLTQGLKALSQRHGLTLFMTVLAGFALVLSRLSNQEDIVIGTPSANRGRLEIEGLIGFFVNTLALRVDLSGHPTVNALLERVKALSLEAQSHQDLPFEQVVELVKPVRSLSHTPVFQVMFAWQNNEGGSLNLPGLQIGGLGGTGQQAAKFDLTLTLGEANGRITGGLNYATSLFEQGTMERWAGYLRQALSQMVADEAQVAASLPILSDAERHKLLVEWNATQAPYPQDLCIHELFEEQVRRDAAAAAVAYEDASLSYGELNQKANRLAHHLIGLGVKPDAPVAICVERSLEMVVGLLAILKAGGAYVPLDPAYPPERLGYMLQDSAPVLVLTHGAARAGLEAALSQLADGTAGAAPLRVVDLDADAADWAQHPATNPDPKALNLTPQSLAYIIYTSGSTGQPKGVMNAHDGVTNRLLWMQDAYRIDGKDAILQKTPFSFDVSVWEFFWTLLAGAKLVMARPQGHTDPDYLTSIIRQERISVTHFVPSMLRAFLEAKDAGTCLSLAKVFCSGEALAGQTVERFHDLLGAAQLHNLYGPTEAAIDATAWDSRDGMPEAASSPPIGRPISNTRIYLLDGLGNVVPEGVAGELYIGGAGVARGYLNRADLTAQRFVASPFVGGDRLYRTGDLGRYLADGNIEFLGRNDHQVKIRGFRIELGEIEARLLSHPGVREAVVMAGQDDNGDKRLVGYYTVADNDAAELDAQQLRSHLSASLPEYMVPAAYVRLDALPLTANGKLDRKALPAPEGDAYGQGAYEAPVGPVETALAQIWSEVLGVAQVGRNDSFFALGGHSLLAIKVLERMRRAGLESGVRALFATPVLCELAKEVATGGIVAPPIAAVDRAGLLTPSFAQQRLWFLAQLEGVSEAYHIPLGLRLRGDLNESALRRALDCLVARHETLRTSFYTKDGELYQRIGAEDAGFTLRFEDLSGRADGAEELVRQIREEGTHPFDLEQGPLIRGRLLRLGDQEHVLLITMHHIVSDGWSMGILSRELGALYEAYSLGKPDPLAPLEIQYADYASWQRQWLSGEVLAEQGAYWQQMLEDGPALIELPTDHRRPVQQEFAGATVGLELDEGLTQGLKALSQRHGLTLFMTVLAGFALVLSRLSNQEDIVIGTPSANRGRLEIEGLIGFFVNTLALRVDLSGHPTVNALLERVKALSLEAQSHQDLPFEQVVELVKPVRSLSHTPVFQVMFAWQNNEGGSLNLPGLQIGGLGGTGQQAAKFDLTLTLGEANGRITGGLNYATSLFEQGTMERWAGYLRQALSQMVADEAQVAASLPILSDAERHKLLVEWNATQAPYPQDLCIHELFEEQVRRDAAAAAVAYEDASLSYGELNQKANRLAHHLIGLGVKPDAPVAICVERSLEMVVGLLAILKAGGAYVPLDPAYPPERLGYMLQDSAPVLVLTHGAARAGLEAALSQLADGTAGAAPLRVVDLDADAADWAQHPATNPDPKALNLTPQSLAYIIYTSGSTGQPKGVMNAHDGVTNRLLWMQDAYRIDGKDAILQKTPFSFDVSVWEFFWTLLAGAKLVMARPQGHTDPDYLTSIIRQERISVTHFVPSMLRAFLEAKDAGTCLSLAKVFCSGEALAGQTVERFHDLLGAAQLHNLYGPTEAAIDATAWDSRDGMPEAASSPPIGRPISNTRIYLLDGLGNVVPEGVAGELYIGGAGVARGYLNRADLTAQRFVASPFVGGDRLYRTGDLGRYLADGNIEFLGRNDHQVKIRGFRIELGEIEARLLSHPGVREAVVMAGQDDNGDKRLVGYYTVADNDAAELDAQQLRSHLSASLPEYMVPAAYVRLDALPLTANGKLDRKALPAPEGDAYGQGAYEAPVGPVETALAQIWSEVLGVAQVGRNDSFFALGGHSLLAIKVLERMRRAGLESGVRALFATPVLCELAKEVATGGIVAPPIAAVDRAGLLTPSFAQQRLWFLAQLEGVSEAYHIPLGLRLRGDLNESALRRALDCLVARHETLRTSFYTKDGELYQRIGAEDAGFTLRFEDLSGRADGAEELVRQIREEGTHPFDLEQGPLIRGRLLRLGDQEHVLLITMHHIVSDGWSMGILSRELGALYEAYSLGKPDPLAPLEIQYADYASWQRQWLSGEVLAEQGAYWQQMLEDGPALIELPTDHRRPVQQEFAGATVGLELDEGLTQGLKALSQRHGLTLFMTVLAGFALVLSRLSNQEDIVIGTPSANRGRLEIEGLIGFFVNTLALRVDLSGHPTVNALLERVKALSLEAQSHQDLPFEQVVELVKPVRSLSHTPVFQVMFAWQNNEGGSLNLPGLQIGGLGGTGQQAAKFDLTLTLGEANGRITGGLNYATSLFEQGTMERWAGYLRQALSQMVADEAQVAASLPILSDAERHKLLVEWNATQAPYPQDLCIHELFEEQVRRDAAAAAVAYEDASLSYGELNQKANRLAHHLIGLGVKPDAPVAICVERSLEMVVGLLAILKAGGAYVPLDPAYPPERLGYMLQDSAPVLVLTHGAARAGLEAALSQLADGTAGAAPLRVVDLDADAADWAQHPATNPDPKALNLTPQSLAYIIYTSGSTGQPKGVMVEHGNVQNFLWGMDVHLKLNDADRFLATTSLSFDISGLEIFLPLVIGATIVISSRETAQDASLLSDLLMRGGISVFQATPSAWQLLKQHDWKPDAPIKALCGGEALKPDIAKYLESFFETAWNVYGPTETTIWSSILLLKNGATDIFIGRPISNTRIYLLDGLGNVVPEGVAGELYIGGAGVARGYLNRADLTAQRFVASPFVGGDRLYRTGDLGRYLADGNIEFLGRNDHQVKIRGFRIELGEIEARLLSHPGVREAVVMAGQDDNGDKRLVGYYTVADNDAAELDAQQLRSHLSASLPEYMVPAAYVRLDALPLTANGKLDRKALPAPEGDAYGQGAYEAPVGPVETALAQIWSEVLGVAQVGRNDSFFALGGHSLLAIKVLERMRRAGLESGVRALFATPVLCELAKEVATGGIVAPPIAAVDRAGLLTPSFAQQRLWFLAQLEGVSEAYHIPLGLRLRGDLNESALRRALDCLVARHETLRTSFYTKDGELYQRIGAEDAGFTLRFEDLSGRADGAEELVRQIREEGTHPFDLEQGPLIRGRLLRLGDQEHVLLITMHHIVSDGWSMGILSRELGALYEAYSLGKPDPLAPLEIQYADYASWQRQWLSGEVLAEQGAYWQQMLEDGPALIELPTDHRRPVQQEFAGATVGLELDEGLTQGLKALSQRHGLTLFMTVLAGFALVLSRLSNQEDIVIGTPSANRGRLEIEGLIGFFVNTLALRVDLSGHPTVNALLERVKALSLEAQSHQDLPFEQVVELVKPVRSLSHTPVFQVMFAWQNNEGGSLNLPGLQIGGLGGTGQQAAKFDLTLTLGEANGRITGGLNYATSLFEQGTMERWAGYLRQALSQMVADEAQVAASLPILSDAERHKLLVEWNATQAPYPQDLCIHELFEEQVRRDAAAAAVAYEDASLSYGELNQKANRLAHHLIGLGVKPDAPVAICVERSLEMVVGLLAILKAGGAYVPLDPAYPPERLGYMLQDSAPVLVLTHGAARAGLEAALSQLADGTAGAAPLRVVDLDADAADWAQHPATNPDPKALNLTPQSLAYIIYTSGSTGQPKGVMVEHGNITNHTFWFNERYSLTKNDCVLQRTPNIFDASIWELLSPLAAGAKIRLIWSNFHGDLSEIKKHLSEDVTILQCVPLLLAALIEEWGTLLAKKLRIVFSGGDALTEKLIYEFNGRSIASLHNLYGPTEAAIDATAWDSRDGMPEAASSPPIGRPISNTRIYLLDGLGNVVPEGVAGELYIGGAGVARGYLNRADLTAQRFVASPFVGGDRLYRTGDLGRYLADGNIEFLGRNDHQVKIRGFRIELGEIEARLLSHPGVREAVVMAGQDDNGDKRLVGYYTVADNDAAELDAQQLRSHLSASLPEYMVPAAYVRLDALPLTANGKLDRKALPAPEGDAYGQGAYEAPVGPVETALAQIWSEVLGVAQVGRNDSFFALGGHSLLAIKVLERMRRAGLESGVRALFATPVLCELAAALGEANGGVEVPANLIAPDCGRITPDLLPLIDLTQDQIDRVVETVPGGVSNVQDIYPLAPLQEGILFHHLMAGEGDPYLLWSQTSFADRPTLDGYIAALNGVIARHDILRTAVVWEGLPEPVQVVWRQAPVAVEEVVLDAADGDIVQQLRQRFDPRHYRIDVRTAPLMRLFIAPDPVQNRWVMMQLFHHLSTDHTTQEVIRDEIQAYLSDGGSALPPALPFRNFVAQARLGVSRQEHEAFFSRMLGDVDEPTAPFGLMDAQGDGSGVGEARVWLDEGLCERLRIRARALGVSAASLCHVAWGLVLARTSGQQDPVFGTVLFGRMQGGEGADRVLGLFINTLPVRMRLGELGVEQSVLQAHQLLAELLHHEHASLALAQRCSAVPAPAPLFTALLNYRHSSGPSDRSAARQAFQGVKGLAGEERTNYPVTLSVEDLGKIFGLTAQAVMPLDPKRLCAMMARALEQLVEALESNPAQPVGRLDILPPAERHKLLVEWNATQAPYPQDLCIHELFEEQVRRDAAAAAVAYEDVSLSYGELNQKANRLAHHLIGLGVKPDAPVAICVERSLEMVVGLLAILKAGGAYVPLDPAYPPERLGYMLQDSAPVLVLTHGAARAGLEAALSQLADGTAGAAPLRVVDLDADAADWAQHPATNPDPKALNLTPQSLAYIIYTSGSTGQPKGVMNAHDGVTNRLLWMQDAYRIDGKDAILQKTPFSFDVSVWEFFWTLLAGAKLVMARPQGHTDPDYLTSIIRQERISVTHFVPSMLRAFLEAKDAGTCLSLAKVFCSGEALAGQTVERFHDLLGAAQLHNLYGPTEAAIDATAWDSRDGMPEAASSPPIGRPISNTRIYLLDGLGNVVPEGVAGELYIGGAGVARGYLNRADLTAQRFVASPFVGGDRLYRTGDLGRYLADGNIEFLGRNDHQVKIRGFRIELGEIEARLLSHPGVREAVVMAGQDDNGDKRLVGYYTVADNDAAELDAQQLRSHLSASLPEYMVPAAYVRLDALPLTANGKLDRKALPAPEGDAYGQGAYEAPVGPVETALAQIWSEVLGVAQVGRNDSFFALGGHSLLAIKVLERMRRAGLESDVRALFATPVLCDIGKILEGNKNTRVQKIKDSLAGKISQLSDDEVHVLIRKMTR